MVGSTPRNGRQPVCRPQLGVKLVALLLRAVVLPVGGIGVREGVLQLVDQRLVRLESAEQGLSLAAPVDAAVLLARAADAPDAVQGRVLVLQALQHQVEGLEPHGHGGKDLALILVDEHALLDVVLGAEVLVEVDFGVRDDGEVGLDDDGCR